MQEYRKKLDALSSRVLRAYFDSTMFLYIVRFEGDKHRSSNFLFDYSYYSIRERAIISTKSIIEPSGRDKLTVEKVITELQKKGKYQKFANEIYLEYKELFNSGEAKRVKDFRDALCHNIKIGSEKMLYCQDIMMIISQVMGILNKIYQCVFNITNEDFYKIKNISMTLADDYWKGICEQADKMPKRHEYLLELQRILNCG